MDASRREDKVASPALFWKSKNLPWLCSSMAKISYSEWGFKSISQKTLQNFAFRGFSFAYS